MVKSCLLSANSIESCKCHMPILSKLLSHANPKCRMFHSKKNMQMRLNVALGKASEGITAAAAAAVAAFSLAPFAVVIQAAGFDASTTKRTCDVHCRCSSPHWRRRRPPLESVKLSNRLRSWRYRIDSAMRRDTFRGKRATRFRSTELSSIHLRSRCPPTHVSFILHQLSRRRIRVLLLPPLGPRLGRRLMLALCLLRLATARLPSWRAVAPSALPPPVVRSALAAKDPRAQSPSVGAWHSSQAALI